MNIIAEIKPRWIPQKQTWRTVITVKRPHVLDRPLTPAEAAEFVATSVFFHPLRKAS